MIFAPKYTLQKTSICCYTLKAMKNWIKRLLSGVAIGVGSAIPGVSGGTIAVIFRVYESIIWAISNFIKQFKKAIVILIPILLGIVIGIIPTMILMDKALESFLFGVICVFAGFIVGSLPKIAKELKCEKVNSYYIVVLALAFVITAGLGILSIVRQSDTKELFENPEVWFYFVMIPVGMAASVALVVPGISGGMILILFGFYKPLITNTTETAKECLSGDWSNFGPQFGILACFGVGVVVGFIIASKIMNYFLTKYHTATFYGIFGFVIGSLVALFLNNDIWEYYMIWADGNYLAIRKEIEIPVGIVLFIICAILSYLLIRYENNREIEESENKEKPEN